MANEGPPLSPSVLWDSEFSKETRVQLQGRQEDTWKAGGSMSGGWARAGVAAWVASGHAAHHGPTSRTPFISKSFQVYWGAGCLLSGSDVQSVHTSLCKHGQPLGAAPFQVSSHLVHTEKPRPLLP